MQRNQVHGVVEMVHNGVDRLDSGVHAVRAIAASEAFRRFDWLKDAPIRNAAGDFRGIVVSARWRTVFDVTGKAAEFTALAGLALNVANSAHEIESIWKSSEPWGVKGSRLSTQVSSIALRTALGVVPAAAHGLAMTLRGYCQIGDLLTGQAISQPGSWEQKIKSMDSSISSHFDHFTDGKYMYLVISTQITPRVSQFIGL